MKYSRKTLVAASIATALAPIGLFMTWVSFDLPLVGGAFLNPMSVMAYLWFVLTVKLNKDFPSTSAKWLFCLFPVAFAVPIWIFCFSLVRPGTFGR